MSEQYWDFITNITDVKEDYNTFSNILLDKINLYLPHKSLTCTKQSNKNKKSWITP